MATLTGSRAKIGRADQHIEALDAEISPTRPGRFWKANPNLIRGQVEGEGLEHAAYLRLTEEPDLISWGLLFGDCIHNLRCVLDHAVYELAIRASGEDPPPKARFLEFPITDDDDKWAKREWRIEPLTDDAKRVIYNAQPYQGWHDEVGIAPLSLLREFDDADKHRLITPTLLNATRAWTRTGGWTRGRPHVQPVETFFELGRLEADAKVASGPTLN